MSRPRVNIALSNGGLNLQGPSDFGISGVLIAAPAAPVAGYGVPFICKSIKQVKAAFVQAGNEPVIEALEKGFYAEAAEGTVLYVLAMAQNTTLTTLFAAVNAEKILIMSNGGVRLLSAIKFPDEEFSPVVANGFDSDVHSAVTAAQSLADSWFGKKKPFRFIIEGTGFTNATAAKDYSTASDRNGHIVVGSVASSTAVATMLVAGRAAQIEPQQNVGRVKSGSLNVAEGDSVQIGSLSADSIDVNELETLYSKRYITFEKNAIASGYVINDDNSLTDPVDDYNNLRYGRIIDNATRISFATYYKELKEDVEVGQDGRLSKAVEKALETEIETAIDQNMRAQLSKKSDGSADVECLVNPDAQAYAPLYEKNGITNPNFNIIQTSQVYLFLRLKPKGCLKYLDVYLGYSA